jgi:hypothetical protein
MPTPSPSAPVRTARWFSSLANLAATLIAAAAVAPVLVAPARPGLQLRHTASLAAGASARTTLRLRGSLWIDCRQDGRRSAQDPAVRDAIVELVTASGHLSTAVTNRAGGYAFTLRGGLPDAVAVPLIQTALDGLVPSPTSDSQPVPGRSIGRRVADLDRVAVNAAGARSPAARYDFGFVSSTTGGRGRASTECSRAASAAGAARRPAVRS